MTESKKAWVEPELIVLVRSKPEEAVLTGCKHYLISTDLNGANSACFVTGCSILCADQAGS
jgi:hypothetical protein